jgi:hypothetical protein
MIYKYPLGLYNLPSGSRILDAQYQYDTIYVWVDISDSSTMESFNFFMVATGDNPPDIAEYIATVQEPPFVWHIYRS